MKKSPPSHLSTEAKALWRSLATEHEIDDAAGLLLLCTALEAFDRMRQSQAMIKAHGVAITDRYNQVKANPAVAAERDSRAAMLASLKALNLDMEPLRDSPGRPSGK